MTSANERIDLNCCEPKNSKSNAPTAGVNVTIVRMWDVMNESIISIVNSLSSQKPGHDQDAAEEYPARVGPYISGLHVAKAGCAIANKVGGFIHDAVDKSDVHKLPEKIARCAKCRPDDNGVIDLID